MDLATRLADCEATLHQIDDLSKRIDMLQELLEKRLENLADAIVETDDKYQHKVTYGLADTVPNADDVIYDETRDDIREALKQIRGKLGKAGLL
jgi:hypothetical protein